MNNYYITDKNFISTSSFQNFIKENPSYGYLKIRAFAASQAIPISGVKVVVSSTIDNNNVIFFEGVTDSSGLIEQIPLPAPILNIDNLNAPNKTTYDITAIYTPDNITKLYKVNMYENVSVIQNINIIPEMKLMQGGI